MKFRLPYFHFGVLFVTLVFLVAIGVPDTAVATGELQSGYHLSSESSSNSGVISARESGVEQTASPPPWSLARMEAAQPYPLPAIESFPDTTGNSIQPVSEPVYIPGVPPAINQIGDTSAGDVIVQSVESINGYDYPAPYTRFENFDSYQQFPYSANGVLFFSQRGSDYRCSAAVVGENALWTAGHCVHDGSGVPEGWSEDVVFVPAYKNGTEPYGRWEYFDLVTRTAWYNGGDLRFDIGGVILHPNVAQQSVRDMVGGLGFAYNLDPIQHWFNIGYPSESPFDGKTMQICSGSFARNATITSAPIPMGMGCDMTKGSSGGAWIINFGGSADSTNYLNGNNSFRYTGLGEEIYSPYFGDAAKDLLYYIATEAEILLPIITYSGDQ
jgi:V8-like Glu-specific endopeptidase